MSFPAPERDVPGVAAPRRVGIARRLVAVALLLLAVAIVAGLVALALTWRDAPDVEPGRKVQVTIPKGAHAQQIAKRLEDAGVIANTTVFVARLRWNGDGARFRSGTYVLRTMSSYDAVVKTLEQGPPAPAVFDVTIPEGFRNTETAARIDQLRDERIADGARPLPAFTGRQYLAALSSARRSIPPQFAPPRGTRSMEGMLFPATYELRNSARAGAIVDRQVATYVDVMQSLDLRRSARANLTPYEVVIIASMVEREARLPNERRLVAAVIYNRLRARMTLGIDATIQYAVSDASWKRVLTESDLAIDSPYNTRLQVGLPPTPIANPGRASLAAAANPADVDYLYYVANPDGKGEHFFTSSYSDFENHPFQSG